MTTYFVVNWSIGRSWGRNKTSQFSRVVTFSKSIYIAATGKYICLYCVLFCVSRTALNACALVTALAVSSMVESTTRKSRREASSRRGEAIM